MKKSPPLSLKHLMRIWLTSVGALRAGTVGGVYQQWAITDASFTAAPASSDYGRWEDEGVITAIRPWLSEPVRS
jgi:hypothetical protein